MLVVLYLYFWFIKSPLDFVLQATFVIGWTVSFIFWCVPAKKKKKGIGLYLSTSQISDISTHTQAAHSRRRFYSSIQLCLDLAFGIGINWSYLFNTYCRWLCLNSITRSSLFENFIHKKKHASFLLILYQIDIGIGQYTRMRYRYCIGSERVVSGHLY